MRIVYAISLAAVFAVAALSDADTLAQDGSIGPPPEAFHNGKPRQFMKSLNEIEPRIKIPELPFVIHDSGSYYVAHSLSGTVSEIGVVVKASDVDLDLNGFSLKGRADSHDAIMVESNCVNVRIRNGVVKGWGGLGVNAGPAADVELTNVRAFTNLGGGIRVGQDSALRGCGAYNNGHQGIAVGSGSTIKNCKARDNAGNGFRAENTSLVDACISIGNADNGFFLESHCTIRDCTATMNASNGIVALTGCRVENNSCGGNGTGNTVGSGILVAGSACRIEGNLLNGNGRGIYAGNEGGGGSWGQGNLIIRNSSRNSELVDFSFHPNNAFGEILKDLVPGTSGITNRNPWLNFVLPGEH